MNGRTLFIGFMIGLIAFAAGLFYTINYAYYTHSVLPEYEIMSDFGAIKLTNVDMINSDRTPIKMRICADPIDVSKYTKSSGAKPLVAPYWFKCYDAKTMGEKLSSGDLSAYILESNTPYGFDVYLAQDAERSFIWRQINECGDAQFSGEPLPSTCPEFKE